MADDARDRFASRFAALLEDSGLQAKQAAMRVNASRPQGASWSVTAGVLSAWKKGRNLPSAPNQDGFFRVVRLLTEHARGRAARGHSVRRLFDEVAWNRLLEQARTAPVPDASQHGEIALYLRTLIEWLNTDPWPRWFDGPGLSPAAIERKLRIANGREDGHYLDADELARRCARLIVLGGPGSGKTWLARRTARMCAETALERLTAGDTLDEVELPLYTTCAWLSATSPSDDIRRAVVCSAVGHLPDLGGARVAAVVRELFEERNAPTLLLADSLDEASGADDRIRQADSLPDSWRIMLTSRPGPWNGQLVIGDDDPSRRVGVLQPLRYPDDVEPFVARWFGERSAWAADLIAQLRDRTALQRAATVPLILAFFCIVGGDEPLPGRRADLYTKVIRRMLTGRWRGSGHRDPDPDACLDTLRAWAWSAATSDLVSGVGTWADEFDTPRVRQGQDDRDALDHVAVPLGQPDADTGMTQRRFAHRSLREHLVAEYVALRLPAEQAAKELLNHLWYDPDWEYAAPAVLATHPQRDQVLNELMHRVTHWNELRQDISAIDGCWQIRRFLARVALESGEGDWPPEAAEMIGQARLDIATSWQADRYQVVVTTGWPTSNHLIIESLLGRLASETHVGNARALAEAVARFAVTAEDRTRVHESLLGLLASETDHERAQSLAEAVAGFGPAAKDQAREALLALLATETDAYRAKDLADAVAGLDPTADDKAKVRETLLAMLDSETDPWSAPRLVEAVTQLVPTAEDKARARGALLTTLASKSDSMKAGDLPMAVAGLNLTAEEKAQAREILLALLANDSFCLTARDLAEAVARLDPTAEDRTRARKALLRVLTSEPLPGASHMLAAVIARLHPAADDRAQAAEMLLALLASETDPMSAMGLAEAIACLDSAAEDQARKALLGLLASETDAYHAKGLAEAVARLDPTTEDKDRARKALLALLATKTDAWHASKLAEVIGVLDPTAEDTARTEKVLLALLATETDPGIALHLAEAVGDMNPTAEDKDRARQVLFALLASQRPHWAPSLAKVIVRLDPTAEDKARVKETLLALLAIETDPRTAPWLADVVAELNPTVTELRGSDTWAFPPTSALLAAARQHSGLPTWLAALPLLRVQHS